jgi:hypothetical protein
MAAEIEEHAAKFPEEARHRPPRWLLFPCKQSSVSAAGGGRPAVGPTTSYESVGPAPRTLSYSARSMSRWSIPREGRSCVGRAEYAPMAPGK